MKKLLVYLTLATSFSTLASDLKVTLGYEHKIDGVAQITYINPNVTFTAVDNEEDIMSYPLSFYHHSAEYFCRAKGMVQSSMELAQFRFRNGWKNVAIISEEGDFMQLTKAWDFVRFLVCEK